MENHFNCIYCYTNKVNGKKYVGQAVDFNRRHKEHINQSHNKKCRDYNMPFHNAIRKYGIENFTIEILKENLQNKENLDYWERFYIKEFDILAKNGKGYNVAIGGEGGNTLEGKTEEELEERSKKISEANRKYWENMTEKEMEIFKEKRKGENNPNYGKSPSEESRKKQSEKMKGENNPMYGKKGENNPMYGKKHTEESIKKMSEKHYDCKGENNPMYGKKHTEESIKKMSGENHPKAKKVKQINTTTKETIKIWDYAKQISEELGFNYNTLNAHLIGRQKGKPYKGYIWEYVE